MNKKGFTLLELLVVVVIIGILAAIALPQYKVAAGKAKFATLKNITKSLKESVERYYLVHSSYPKHFNELDIDLVTSLGYADDNVFSISVDDITCEIWINDSSMVICRKKISGELMRYFDYVYPNAGRICEAYSKEEKSTVSRICQAETGKNINDADCAFSGSCRYSY